MTTMTTAPKVGGRSKWGSIQDASCWGEGITLVSTAGHGGFKLDARRNRLVPAVFRNVGGWYEEDVEAAIVLYFLADRIDRPGKTADEWRASGLATLKSWFWDRWETHSGETVDPAESSQKRSHLHRIANRDNFLVSAAYGDWDARVPKGMTGVIARRESDKEEGFFLVPAAEYAADRGTSFVVDTERHQRLS